MNRKNRCSFSWELVKTAFGTKKNNDILELGKIESPDAEPGETVGIKINCNDALQRADLFLFTATDHNGKEIYTWSWPVVQPKEKAEFLGPKSQKGMFSGHRGDKEYPIKLWFDFRAKE